MRENREIPCSPTAEWRGGTRRKGQGRNPPMNEQGKSHRPMVPTKPPNKVGPSTAEVVEGRGLAKENVDPQNTHRTQRRARVHSELEGVRRFAKQNKEAKFSALFHHITLERLRLAFMDTNRKASAGVDGVTWEQYESNLEGNLQGLYERLRRGAYRAKSSRRVYIPKADGRQRPLGVAALEDKIVQRAVVEVLNAIYEEDFLGFSYGFRPGRGQHDALDALVAGIKRKKVSFVLDADIRGFFDAINHEWLVKFIEHRIADKRVLRLIQKWLSAGVMENGMWTKCEEGTPQGATVSPLLANIYLHYVLDLWIERRTMQKRMTAKLHELKLELQQRRHQPIPEQGRWLQQVVGGYFGYYGVPGNEKRLRSFRDQLKRLWLRALRRRGQRDKMNWARMGRLEDLWIPPVQWHHPWPEQRFDANTQGRSPVR